MKKKKLPTPLYKRIYEMVLLIPEGNVGTYGQIAKLVGGCNARVVGFAMAALKNGPHPDVPWHRVINAKGRISMHGIGSAIQYSLLQEEGIEFDNHNTIDLNKYQWQK